MFVLVLLAIWCALPAYASVNTVQKMTGAPSQVTVVTESGPRQASLPLYPFFLPGSFSGLASIAKIHSKMSA